MLRWLVLATVTAVLMSTLLTLDAPLRTPETPQGIVGLELAATEARAAAIVTTWRQAAVLEDAKRSLRVDMAFLLAYPWFLWSSMGRLRRPGQPRWLDAPFGGLQRGVLLCAPLDLVENVLLWFMVDHGATAGAAAAATICAAVKFLLVLAALAWCLLALAQRLAARAAPR